MTKKDFVKALEKIGGKYWETSDGKKQRVYFNPVDWVKKAGYDLSNNKKRKLSWDKVWYDLIERGWYFKDSSGVVDLNDIIKTIKDEIKKLGVDPDPRGFDEPKKNYPPESVFKTIENALAKEGTLVKTAERKIKTTSEAEQYWDKLVPPLKKYANVPSFARGYLTVDYPLPRPPADALTAWLGVVTPTMDSRETKKLFEYIREIRLYTCCDYKRPIIAIALEVPEAPDDYKFGVLVGPRCGDGAFYLVFPNGSGDPSAYAPLLSKDCAKLAESLYNLTDLG